MAEPQLWEVRQALIHGWWVTEGEWEPGHPDRVKATVPTMKEALGIARDHNSRMGLNGRPAVPLSADTVRYAMRRNKFNVSAAARELGVNRKTLQRWFEARFKEVDERDEVRQHPPLKSHKGAKRA